MKFLCFLGDEETVEIEKPDETIQKDEIKDESKAESLTLRKNEVEMKNDWETKKIIKDENDVKKENNEESEEKEEEKEVGNQMEDNNIATTATGEFYFRFLFLRKSGKSRIVSYCLQ